MVWQDVIIEGNQQKSTRDISALYIIATCESAMSLNKKL